MEGTKQFNNKHLLEDDKTEFVLEGLVCQIDTVTKYPFLSFVAYDDIYALFEGTKRTQNLRAGDQIQFWGLGCNCPEDGKWSGKIRMVLKLSRTWKMIRKNSDSFDTLLKMGGSLILKAYRPSTMCTGRVDKLSHLQQFSLIAICAFGEPRPSKMAWNVFLRQNKNEALHLVVHSNVNISFWKGRVQVLAGLQSQNFSKWQFSFMSKSTQL